MRSATAPAAAKGRIGLPQPDTDQWQDKPGVAVWKTALEANSKATFQAHYTVTYPKGIRVIGLP